MQDFLNFWNFENKNTKTGTKKIVSVDESIMNENKKEIDGMSAALHALLSLN